MARRPSTRAAVEGLGGASPGISSAPAGRARRQGLPALAIQTACAIATSATAAVTESPVARRASARLLPAARGLRRT